MSFFTPFRNVLAGLAIAAGLGAPAWAQSDQAALSIAAAGPSLTNTAQLSMGAGAQRQTIFSNTVNLNLSIRARPTVRLLRLAGAGGMAPVDLTGGQCQVAGQGFVKPLISEDQRFDPAAASLNPRGAESFHAGEPIFVDVSDESANLDPTVRDTHEVTITTSLNDQETLRLIETAADTGRFIGYIETSEQLPPTAFDCKLSSPRGMLLQVSLVDPYDPENPISADALIDPYGYVFDSKTGLPVSGAKVTVIDNDTGLPAEVTGDDGVSAYPSSVISGADVTDGGGAFYEFDAGEYRFPLLAKGRYHLLIEPPAGYTAPSLASETDLSGFVGPDNRVYQLVPASWGRDFELVSDALQVDIPLDPFGYRPPALRNASGLHLEKTASTAVGSLGDFIQYRLKISTLSGGDPQGALTVDDVLPAGFRYVAGSSRRGGTPIADPTVGADGVSLSYRLVASTAARSGEITYAAVIGAGAPEGDAVNRAIAYAAAGAASNRAEATVRVEAALQSGVAVLIGRVSDAQCDAADTVSKGVAGVRILLENGTFVVSDRDGLFHFEGVQTGVHVVQLDLDSLPAGYEAIACGSDTRTGGKSFSQFVDLQGGQLQRVEFRLRRTAQAAPAKALAAAKPASGLPTDWFAGQAPGIGWVFPGEAHNPAAPAIRVAIKMLPGQSVALSVNGAAADPLTRDGTETSTDGAMAVALWRGVPLIEGVNTLTAVVTESGGKVVARLERKIAYVNTPARASLVAAASQLSADGMGNPVIAVRFTDRQGHPVRSGTSGMVDVAAPYAAASDPDAITGQVGDGRPVNSWRVEGDDGVALIRLAPTTQAGSVLLRFNLPGEAGKPTELRAWLSASRKNWVVVGFAAGSAGFETLSRNAQPLSWLTRDRHMVDGQLAFYAKGRVKGSWLLTLAYDNKRTVDPSLKSTIDPDRYYTLYGDGSSQAYDAASQRKLYVRLERAQFYALFGDFDAGFNASELGRYTRTLNGVKFERSGRTFSFAGFAAQTSQTHIRDELQGSGLAGGYRLSHHDLAPGGETVTLETRDRVRQERVLTSRSLVRGLDYDIDYVTGELRLRDPAPSHDAEGNPNIIGVDYEVRGAGDEVLTAGARVGVSLADDKVKAGLTVLRDQNDQAVTTGQLMAGDLTVQLDKDTSVKFEAAASQAASQADGAERQSAYLAEFSRHTEHLDLSAYVRQQDQDFGLGQQSVVSAGTRKLGADARLELGKSVTAAFAAYHETVLSGGAERDAVDARLDYRRGDLTLNAGLKSVRDQTAAGSAVSNLLTLGASQDLLNRRLQISAASDFALGSADSADFPVRRRVGAAYQLSEGVRAFIAHEMDEGRAYRTATTRAGLEGRLWSGATATSSISRQALSAFGPRSYAQLGLNQTFRAGKAWTFDAALDSSRTLSGNTASPLNPAALPIAGEDFTALSLGAAYRADVWSWNGRAEARRGANVDAMGLHINYLRRVRETLTASVTFDTQSDRNKDGDRAEDNRVSAALAWRPLDSAWSALEKLEIRDQTARGAAAGQALAGYGELAARNGASKRVVNNLALNFDSGRGQHGTGELQASLYYGAKYVHGQFDGDEHEGFSQVIGLQARYDLSPRIDLGLNLSARTSSAGGAAHSFGPSIGVSPAADTWLEVGWNIAGYKDRDFEATSRSRQGLYVAARVKFDQTSLAGLGRSLKGFAR